MNVLELLQAYLQRAQAGDGTVFDRLRGSLGDTLERAPGQPYTDFIGGEQLHPNALGIYAQPRSPPAGDVVIRSGRPTYTAPYMPQAQTNDAERWLSQQNNPSFSPFPGGSRISSPLNQLLQRDPFALY
jgi:hypothetical protein